MRNALALTALTVFVIVGYFLFFRSTTYTNYPPHPGPIVAFGDSLIEGVGSTAGNDLVSLLSKQINEPIENFGVSGDTTAMGLARLDSALARNPRVAIILLGGNDYLRRVDKQQTFDNLRAIIKKFHDSGSVVLLLGVRGGLLADNYEKEFALLAKDTGSAYVSNILEDVLGDKQLLADQIHPNDKGYALIAKRVLPTLQALLH